MSDTMAIEDYLRQGGVLTNPSNVPPRYRGELLRLMATFVDSELAGSAGFADVINDAPSLKARIAASRIVLEKTDHAGRVLDLMGTFGADTARYAVHHPWAARLDRDADLGAARRGSDMRLSVFHYPLRGWIDAVVMNVLMGRAVGIQLQEFSRVSYAPLADVFREIAPREARHAELGEEGLARIVATAEGCEAARRSVAFWRPRVAASFGREDSTRFDTLQRFGLRHRTNQELLAVWATEMEARLEGFGLG
ncbi:Phenylacetic acid catabolic protein [Methylobacterium aquaticum]|uniref:Phenylacetic acid catabolic protein n=1 Tax=Methylobacterium aquaticum TaxID=270351 RepID=UPI0019330CB8|nr:Phenylacetic acid catabolic protein [Methylobacterium aquaticum]QRE77086.1 phenylacetic acid catabolic [Methylobacterium aquaticum]